MKLKGALLMVMVTIATILTGCEPLLVLDPKGPQAERQASDIMLIHWNYVGHCHCCSIALLVLFYLSIVLQNKAQIMNHLTLREILGLKRFWLVFQYLIVAYLIICFCTK